MREVNNYDCSMMDLISRIIESEYVNVNGDLIAIKANILQDYVTNFREAAKGVLEESPDCFKIDLR